MLFYLGSVIGPQRGWVSEDGGKEVCGCGRS